MFQVMECKHRYRHFVTFDGAKIGQFSVSCTIK